MSRAVKKDPKCALAIDFETASAQAGSACSIGLAWIEGGAITRVEERLIRPPENIFAPINISIHGIHPEMVEDAPSFPAVMEEFEDDFASHMLIAHNAGFDMAVLRSGYHAYSQTCPEIDFLCTLALSRLGWREVPNHKLSTLAAYLGRAFKHHNAAQDAQMCAHIALKLLAEHEAVADFSALAQKLGAVPGRVGEAGVTNCKAASKAVRRARPAGSRGER